MMSKKALPKRSMLFLCLCLLSCYAGHEVMTMDVFYDIHEGQTQHQIIAKYGKPYRVRKQGNDTVFEYIERIRADDRTIEQRHYFLIFEDGVLKDKKMNTDEPNPFDRNAIDIQRS